MALFLKNPAADQQLTMLVKRIKARNESYGIDTGRDLLQAKDVLKHGEFGPWLKANFGWSASTAQNYMNAAKLAEKNPTVVNLKPAALMALAAPSTPDVVKSEVIADLHVGKVSTPKEIKAKIATAKPHVKPLVLHKAEITAKAAAILDAGIKNKVAASADLDLVERLKAVGPDAAIEAFNAAFGGVDLELRIGGDTHVPAFLNKEEAAHAG